MGFLDIFRGVGMLLIHSFSSTVSGKGFGSPLFLRGWNSESDSSFLKEASKIAAPIFLFVCCF